MRSILLAGAGVISPDGVGASPVPRPSELFDWGAAMLPDIDPADYGWGGLNRQSRIGKYAMLAIGEAFRSADVHVPIAEPNQADRTALIIYTSNSTLEPILSLYKDAEDYGVNHVNPGIFPDTVLNAIGGHASIYFRITGPNLTVSNTSPSALTGMQHAHDLLATGDVDQVICCSIHIHPPARLRQLAGGRTGPESIVALLFRRDQGEWIPESTPNAVRIGWQGPLTEAPLCFTLVPRNHSFLALAAFVRGEGERRLCGDESRFAVSHPEGSYTCVPILTRIGEDEHA